MESLSKLSCRVLELTDLKRAKGLMHGREGTSECLEGIKNVDKLDNPAQLEPVSLPLKLKSFQKLPVIVSAGSDAPGKPLHLITLLYMAVDNQGPKPSIEQRRDRARHRERRGKDRQRTAVAQADEETPEGHAASDAPGAAPSGGQEQPC